MEAPGSEAVRKRRVILLEPWLGGSHRAFAERWADTSRHAVSLEGLPPRHWRWRQEASAWELGRRVAGLPRPDVLAVTDYVDLPRLLGFLPPGWAGVPTLAYFHENQLTYRPAQGAVPSDAGAAFANVLTAVRADTLVFNSAFHRDDFARAADAFLRALPRPNPRAELEGAVRSARVVAPAPALAAVPLGGGGDGRALRVLFPHRLEEDKDPLTFARAVGRAAASGGVELEVVLSGGDPAAARGEAREAIELLAPHVLHAGVPERAEYLRRAGTCDVVASTARHEFFGVAVAEAMAAGCAPLLPARLNYPALVARWEAPGEVNAGLFEGGVEELAERLVGCAGQRERFRSRAARAACRAGVMHLDAAVCVDALDRVVDRLAG